MPTFADTVLSARDNALPVIAKTPQLERQEIAKLLECGAVGIQLPRTEHRSQVEELMSYIKFPPTGTRATASGYGNSDYLKPSLKSQWIKEQDSEKQRGMLYVFCLEKDTGGVGAGSIQ